MGVIFNFDLTNMEAFLWSCGWSKEYILVVKKKKNTFLNITILVLPYLARKHQMYVSWIIACKIENCPKSKHRMLCKYCTIYMQMLFVLVKFHWEPISLPKLGCLKFESGEQTGWEKSGPCQLLVWVLGCILAFSVKLKILTLFVA